MSFELVPLGKLANIIGGYAFKSSNFAEKGIPVVKIADIQPPIVNLDSCQCVTEKVVKGLERFRLEKHDILMAMTGATIGKVGRIKSSQSAYVNQRVAKISAKAGREYDGFIYALVSQDGFEQKVLDSASGSAQANVSADGIGRILVPNPPLPEQRAIASILGDLDAKIEVNRAQNATLEALAQTLFRAWFVDFEPVKAKSAGLAPVGLDEQTAALFPSEFEDEAANMELPKGWKRGVLGDLCTIRRETVQPSSIDGSTPYIGLEHMPQKSIALGEWGKAEDADSTKSRFFQGDILFGKLRPYFHKVGIAPVDGICSTDILVIRPLESAFGLVLCCVSSEPLISYVSRLADGAKMPRVSWKDLANYPLAVPPELLQQAFSVMISNYAARIENNLRENRTLAQLRDQLLPRLLSGRLKVPESLVLEFQTDELQPKT